MVGVAIVISSGLGVVNPLMIKKIFDDALFGPSSGPAAGTCSGQACPNMHALWVFVGIMVLIPIVTSAIGVGQTYLSNLVGLQVMQDLRNSLYKHLQYMPLRFFTTTRTGEIQSRLANDVGGVQSVVTSTAASLLSNVVIIVSSLIAMLLISVQLTILSLCLTPIFVWLTVKVGRARRKVATSTAKTLADLTAITEETLSVSGILLAKSFGRQRHEIERYRDENERLTNLTIRQTMIGQSFFAVVGTFFSIMPAVVYLVAGYVNTRQPERALSGRPRGVHHAPIADLLPDRIDAPGVERRADVVRAVRPDLRVPRHVAGDPGRPGGGACRARSGSRAGAAATGAVPLRHAPTGPSPDLASGHRRAAVDVDQEAPRPWTLDGVDLEILPGQLAALVGPSGAGKTTITYLVPRLYDVQEGAVEIDGIDVRKIALESLGDMIGVVTQETYLFNTTIRRNLLYGKPDATQEELEAAARAANIHDRIVELDEGYDTIVGERGYKMSGGEKQRLAIARVILKDPRILILDEATSSLDTMSERLVQAALEPLMEGRTTIAIAHRLSTILKADVIFVIDRGRVAERGSHDELLDKGGLYAQLYQQQFKGGLVQAECEDGVILADGQVVRNE